MPMRVLTVDDTRTARLVVRKCFEELGYPVLEAPNGQAALDLLSTEGPVDVIVLDWHMPVMDGLTCLTEIRKNSAYDETKGMAEVEVDVVEDRSTAITLQLK